MALITRVSRLFQADFHAVLDRIEEPDLLLRQALREMEDSFSSDQQQLKLLQHERAHLENRGRGLGRELQQMDDELDICFSSRQEELARALIRRKLEAQRHLQLTEEKRASIQDACLALKQKLSEQQVQLENIRQKVELLSEQPLSADYEGGWQPHAPAIADDEIEIAFLKERQRRSPS